MSTLAKPFAFPESSAGSETYFKRKRSFDDLLLRSSHTLPSTSSPESPYFFNQLQLKSTDHVNKKAKTAPASPLEYTAITPKPSPPFSRAQLVPAPVSPWISTLSAQPSQQQVQHLASSSSTSSRSTNNTAANSIATNNDNSQDESNEDDENDKRNGGKRPEQIELPSLKHLQLLPNPNIQEHAYHYPDTSEHTPLWRQNLVHWCREKSHEDYLKIIHEVQKPRNFTVVTQGLSLLANVASVSPTVPSILTPKDQFYELSNNSLSTPPVTPPMSPASTNKEDWVETRKFTPFVSEKLVQTIRMKRTYNHKKTNSFKARELKKLMENRDILSVNSRAKVAKPQRKKSAITASSQQVIMKLDNPSASSSSGKTTPRSTSPIRSSTPPRYHTFVVSSPSSPTTSSAINASKYTHNEFSAVSSSPQQKKHTSSRRNSNRSCVSCHSSDSPCWRPSWSERKQDQLCNSCGLRYKKTHTRCLNDACRKIPSKGELALMKSNGIIKSQLEDGTVIEGLGCLFCGSIVETGN